MRWILQIALILAGSGCIYGVFGDDDGDDIEGSHYPKCLLNPQNCDGTSLSHFAIGETLAYQVNGNWQLQPPTSPHPYTRTLTSQQANVEGHAYFSLASPCTLKITLTNMTFSDLTPARTEETTEKSVETWVRVNGEDVEAVCGRTQVDSPYNSRHHTLARSLASAVINSFNDLKLIGTTMVGRDYQGKCTTRYELSEVWQNGHEVIKTRDLSACTSVHPNTTPLSTVTSRATWSCRQHFVSSTKTSHDQIGKHTLQSLSCDEQLSLPESTFAFSSLNLTFLEVSQTYDPTQQEEDLLQPLDLDERLEPSSSSMGESDQVYNILADLCTHLESHITPHTTTLYPQLLSHLSHLPKEMLVQIYHEVSAGRICPQHQKLRDVFMSALRDCITPAAAAAKCHLMTSRSAEFSHTWAASLTAVKEPTEEALLSCAEILSSDHWEDGVLGVSAMAGWAAKRCQHTDSTSHPCEPNHSQCQQGFDVRCDVGDAVNVIVNHLAGWLTRCSSKHHEHQVVLAMRGLSNIGDYGTQVESSLKTCAYANSNVPLAVRVAAIYALGHGPCSLQIQNWLKWEILNETSAVEFRISGFLSLRRCNQEEAEAIAMLITQKDSQSQVKSFLSDFVKDSKIDEAVRPDRKMGSEKHWDKQRDARQFSRHLVANLSSLLGMTDTMFEADLIFQNSFLPRSFSFNVSSPLLHLIGGSAHGGIRLENLENLLQSVIGPGGMAEGGISSWLWSLVVKMNEMFGAVSDEFVDAHRSKRSTSRNDVSRILARVKQEVKTELRGWIWGGAGGRDGVFKSFTLDPLHMDWQDQVETWLEHIFDLTYSALINSHAEATTGWSTVDDEVGVFGLLGVPMKVWRQAGVLATVQATSKVNILHLLTNPTASALSMAFKPSVGVYQRTGLQILSFNGPVSSSTTKLDTGAADVTASLGIYSGDQVEFKVDLPEASVINSQTIHTFDSPHMFTPDTVDDNVNIPREVVEDTCNLGIYVEPDFISRDNTNLDMTRTASSCNRGLDAALGVVTATNTWLISGHNTIGSATQYSLSKSPDVNEFRLALSWKNPGSESVFIDVQFETDEVDGENRRAGLVLGVMYSNHITLRLQLHAHQFNLFAEGSLVNDPNLKRIEGHLGFLDTHYGIKAELLMVTDGGHVTVKPRFVIAYPGNQEDALLEGYLARYHSEKMSRVTVDLYTDGLLKHYMDVAVNGTAEFRRLPIGTTIIAVKDFHLTCPVATVGLNAALSLKDNAAECSMQVSWQGDEMMVEGRVEVAEPKYWASFEVSLPNHPHLNTQLNCITHTLNSQITNNVTLMVGNDRSLKEFTLTHSTNWHGIDLTHLSADAFTAKRRRPAFRVDNSLNLTSTAVGLDWQLDHSLVVSDRAIENYVSVQIDNTAYTLALSFYDQSQVLLKYHTELEVNLGPQWHLNYTDTLEQIGEGRWVGRSSALMPSKRLYTTLSTLTKDTASGGLLIDARQEVAVSEPGGHSWTITAEESFIWTASNKTIRTNLLVGDISLFGVEASLSTPNSSVINGNEADNSTQLALHLNTWAHDVYQCELLFGAHEATADFNFMLLIIPLNREIRSKVAVGHNECTGGSVDGQVVWGARGNPAHTLTLSSTLHFPQDSQPLQLRGTLSVLGLVWDARLELLLGKLLDNTHRLTFTLILPDNSRLEVGSELDITILESELGLLSGFYFLSPAGKTHNVSVVGKYMNQNRISNSELELFVDSPISQEIKFYTQVHRRTTKKGTALSFSLNTHSEAEYWKLIDVETRGWCNMSSIEAEADLQWGNHTLQLEASGYHRENGDTHEVELEAKVQRPWASTWKNLSSSFVGAFTMTNNAPRIHMLQNMIVLKDDEEIFKSNGEILVNVPDVEGNLTITHSGNTASRQDYVLEGKFTGKEIQLGVEGSIDDVPVRLRLDYVDGQQIQLVASYHTPNHFTLSLTTHLNDFTLGFRRGGGTSYSLSTIGKLLYRGHTTKLTHQVAISPTETSSNFTLIPLMDRPLSLQTIRTKHDLNSWQTNVELSWGERVFRYQDEVRFPSISDFSVQIMVEAPELDIQHSQALVETGNENMSGQWLRILLRQRNITKHSARMMFYKHDAGEERVWEAGVEEVVVDSTEYRDMHLYHTFTPLTSGIEVRSNMTLGETPLVAVGMKATDHTRVLLMGLCTANAECIRLHAHTYAHDEPSSRTFTLAIHALNSLFFKHPNDPLIQNTVTIEVQQMRNRLKVSGGLVRVECMEVNCISTIPRGLLHSAFSLTHNTLGLTVNTTERTVALRTVVRHNQAQELPGTSLPGGHLTHTFTVKTQLWLDKRKHPRAALVWASSMAAYASARAKERIFHSSLYHPSISKPLVVGGRMVSEPTSTSVRLILDVFSQPEDSLLLHVALQHNSAQRVLSANLTKSNEPNEPVVSVLGAVLPSPDSGEVKVMVVLPPNTPTSSPQDNHFTLNCKINTKLSDNVLSCKMKTASIEEEAVVGYEEVESDECWHGGMWIALLNRTFSLNHHSCQDPINTHTALTKKVDDSKDELALKFGLVNARRAELDLLGSAGVSVQLYPPFLLHTTAHHTHSLQAWWENILVNAQEELSTLASDAKSVVQILAYDIEKTKVSSSVSPSTPVSTLGRYLRRNTRRMIHEAKRDQLVLDIVQSAKACVSITSVILEAGATYLTYNYGPVLFRMQRGFSIWWRTLKTNTWAAMLDFTTRIHNFASSTYSNIVNLPTTLLNFGLSLPIVGEAVHWMIEQLNTVHQSSVFKFIANAMGKAVGFINMMLSLMFIGDETVHHSKNNEDIWRLWVPLLECSYSMPGVWDMMLGKPHYAGTCSLTDSLLHWTHLITHPRLLWHHITPPFPGEGAIIGDENIISVDGHTYSLSSSPHCSRVLLTDSRNGLFTLVGEWNESQDGIKYTLMVAEGVLSVQGDLQVTLNDSSINLPYLSNSFMVKRDDRRLSLAALDKQGREVVSLVCWSGVRRACVIGVSGWLHGDTRAILGNFNLDKNNDFMRPGGKVTQSQEVFVRSWELGGSCGIDESVQPQSYPSQRTIHLCSRFLLHYTSYVFPCHDAVNIKPYHDTCLQYLASVQDSSSSSSSSDHDSMNSNTQHSTNHFNSEPLDFDDEDRGEMFDENELNETVYEVRMQDVLVKVPGQQDILRGLSSSEGTALCDVAAAYSTVCARHGVDINLPLLCEDGVVPSYEEPLSVNREVDVVMVISEDTCDSFMYNQLARPLPHVLARVAAAKNISDIQVGVLGYGSGGSGDDGNGDDSGDVVYRTRGASLFTPASQLRITRPPHTQQSRASLLQAMKAVSTFPFRPGSVRLAILLRCDDRDIPTFTDSLPLEMMRRRLTLFTLTPETLQFNPSQPSAVSNTIGMDRWRVYNLRLDRPHSTNSWGVRQPSSNVAQLALKSGGGVFSVSEVRQEPRVRYLMKLFRRVLSKSVVRVVQNIYRHQHQH